jgi:TolB-like protein/DNA-binding winged helix-turn-helix (wHTH) protein/Tfp pilus assembly protein PilF
MDALVQRRFGRIAVEPGRRQLLVDGRPVKVGARAFDVLMALIERRERVVSKDELLNLVWLGVTVEEGNLQVHIAALRKLLGADAIATFPGRGYQFAAQLETQPQAVACPPTEETRTDPQRVDARASGWRRRLQVNWRPLSAAAAGLFILLAAGVWRHENRTLPSGTPTLAVMPFANIGGDASSDSLAKAITTGVATDFSRLSDLDVIASSVTASYDRKDADIRKTAGDLNVRYVLTGTVQREGEIVQISAELVDGKSGASLWSDRWKRPAGADALAFQNDVADEIASTLGSRNFLMQIAIADAKEKPPADRTAYDLFALGYESYIKGTEQGFADAIPLYDAAIAKNPRLTFAYVQRGWSTWLLGLVRLRGVSEAQSAAERFARMAIAIDPSDAEAHVMLGDSLVFIGRFAEAGAEIDRALRLDPSSADVIVKAALAMSYLGRPEEGAELCDRAHRLNALSAPFYSIHCFENYFFTGRYRDSLDMLRRTDAWLAQNPYRLAFQAAAQTQLGETDDAAVSVAELKRKFPDTSAEALGLAAIFARTQELDQIVASLGKAGAPICISPDQINGLQKSLHLGVCDAERAKQAAAQ